MKSKNFKPVCLIICFGLLLLFSQSCKKKEDIKPEPQTGDLTDSEGNYYKTVKIADRWWMAQNLRVKSYRDGSPINKLANGEDWAADTIGGFYKKALTSDEIGLLYNYYAVSNIKNIAPVGWHIATDQEWKDLEKSVGMLPEDVDKTSWRGTNQGEKLMKERDLSTAYWEKYNDVWATDDVGFAALAGGCIMFNGAEGDIAIQHTGFWWTATTEGKEVWYRYLDYKNKNVFRYYGPKSYGFSVRCVKDY